MQLLSRINIRRNGEYPANWTEKVYQGVHSDVGGGYPPDEQGVSNNYARIPMRMMMREAVGAGEIEAFTVSARLALFLNEIIDERSRERCSARKVEH